MLEQSVDNSPMIILMSHEYTRLITPSLHKSDRRIFRVHSPGSERFCAFASAVSASQMITAFPARAARCTPETSVPPKARVQQRTLAGGTNRRSPSRSVVPSRQEPLSSFLPSVLFAGSPLTENVLASLPLDVLVRAVEGGLLLVERSLLLCITNFFSCVLASD